MSSIKEGSDINVGRIEKDIERCEELIKTEHANWIGISNQLAIAHILDRIKELEEENKKHTIKLTDEEYRKVIENAQRDIKKQFEQKVKDKIEELDKLQKEMITKKHNTDNINDCYQYGNEAQKVIYKKEALEELLEEK